MTLHCLYIARDTQMLERLLASAESGDALLLLSSAVTLARGHNPLLERWQRQGGRVYALEEDLAAYGSDRQHETFEVVDYPGWVALSIRHPKQQVWR